MNDEEVYWLLCLITVMLHYLSFAVAVYLWSGYEVIVTDFKVQM
jgi:hypothetical protein